MRKENKVIIIMDEGLKNKLEKIVKKEWWPAAELAKILERPKTYIYRRIRNKNFSVMEDGTFQKVLSKSVVEFYEKRFQKTVDAPKEPNDFKKGFFAGLRVYEIAKELNVTLDDLQEMIALYCEGDHYGGDIE